MCRYKADSFFYSTGTFPENSVLLRVQPSGKWLLFHNPVDVVETRAGVEIMKFMYLLDEMVEKYGFHVAGFLSYESGAAFDDALIVKQDDFPLLWFGVYGSVLEFESLEDYQGKSFELTWSPELEYDQYLNDITLIRHNILKGNTYQVNYTYRLRSEFMPDPWLFFHSLAESHDPPFAAYISTPEYAVCSFSPELFIMLDQHDLLSRPMKGTIGRGPGYWNDQMQSRSLRSCPKNRAENVMITDMVRNDLGRVAEPGSVKVPSLFQVEKYPSVWQMISQVRCSTKARIPFIMKAMFPPASITGAPKSAAMSIIAELEPSPRRVYTGSIGYSGPKRQSQFNVAIRTVLVDKERKQAEYGVGGGIVWDSKAQSEWDESRIKARSLHRLNPGFSLLETILWTPEGGYHLLGAHLHRLKCSADYFSYKVDMEEVKFRLEIFSDYLKHECWKIRLFADKMGRVSIEKAELGALPEYVALSPAMDPVDSSDPFLFHKTTHRDVYNSAVPRSPHADSVMLWNKKGQLTESVTANIVVEIGQVLYTPPERCGLLAGTYRQFLLATGIIREKIVLLEDLNTCQNVYLINSVRGFIRARLV